VTNIFLPRTNQAGSPWLRRSVTSGNERQMLRSSSSGSSFITANAARRRSASPSVFRSEGLWIESPVDGPMDADDGSDRSLGPVAEPQRYPMNTPSRLTPHRLGRLLLFAALPVF